MKLTKKRTALKSKPTDPSKDMDISKRIVPVNKVASDLNIILYGRSGTGKTTLSASFPKPLLLIDCNDKGTDSISDVAGVDVLRANSWSDLVHAYWYVKQSKKYKTVVIDTVSNLQGFAIVQVKGSEETASGKQVGDWGTMTKRDWGQVASMLKSLLTDFRDLDGVNAVFIAQDRVFNADDEDTDNDGQIQPEVGPRLMPSVASTINAAVNIIGNTFVRERVHEYKLGKTKKTKRVAEYCLRVGPHAYYTTKLRKPKGVQAPAFIKDPTYEKIIATSLGKEE